MTTKLPGLTAKEASEILYESASSASISLCQLAEALSNLKKQSIVNKHKHKSKYHN